MHEDHPYFKEMHKRMHNNHKGMAGYECDDGIGADHDGAGHDGGKMDSHGPKKAAEKGVIRGKHGGKAKASKSMKGLNKGLRGDPSTADYVE